MKGTFGLKLKQLLATYNPSLQSWKMSEDISRSDLKRFSKTLPKLGMMQDGQLLELAMSELPIKEQDYSLLPTPVSNDAKAMTNVQGIIVRESKGHQLHLQEVLLLPTPTAMHTRNHDEPIENYMKRVQDYKDGKTKGKPGASVGVAVRLYNVPTPTASDSHWEATNAQREGIKGNHNLSLPNWAKLIATPTLNSYHQTGRCRNWGGDLIHDLTCQCAPYRIHWSMPN
jgi:hypothetical protein